MERQGWGRRVALFVSGQITPTRDGPEWTGIVQPGLGKEKTNLFIYFKEVEKKRSIYF